MPAPLLKAARVDTRYIAVALAAAIPGGWSLLHSNTLKRKILPLVLGIAKYR